MTEINYMNNEYDTEFIIDKLDEINRQISEEVTKENCDNEKLFNLRCQQLIQGIKLSTGYKIW